jgi:hypothetical protein
MMSGHPAVQKSESVGVSNGSKLCEKYVSFRQLRTCRRIGRHRIERNKSGGAQSA